MLGSTLPRLLGWHLEYATVAICSRYLTVGILGLRLLLDPNLLLFKAFFNQSISPSRNHLSHLEAR